MKLGRFFIDIHDENIMHILSQITDEKIRNVKQVCERYGFEVDDVRYYGVYEVDSNLGKKILKQTEIREMFNYETFLFGKNYSVPKYYGKYIEKDIVWILIENVTGDDLRNMTDELAISSANCLA